MKHGFDDLKLEEIYAVAFPENTKSIRVMQKIGMKPLGLQHFYGKMLETYVIKRS